MITRLPRWIEFGAFTLAAVAGFVNVIGLLGFEHQAVSHLSGSASQLATTLSHVQPQTLHLLAVLLAFTVGAALSGMVLGDQSLTPGRPYATLLLLEAILLIASVVLLQSKLPAGHYTASMACGLQNALATTFSGAIVRTTHLTGIVTDLGIMLGHWLRGKPLDRRKGILFLLIIMGFISGGWLASLCFEQWKFTALLLPAALCVLLALVYRFWLTRTR